MATISRSTTRRRRRSRYNVFPRWVTRKRAVLSAVLIFSVLIVGAGVYGVRLSFALAKTFHTNPFSAVAGILGGGGGSDVDQKRQHLERINLVLYGYGGAQHDGGYLSDSIMVVSILPQANHPPQVAEISIPRDWYVNIPLRKGVSTEQRINFAYAAGMLGEGPVPASAVDAGAAVADPLLEHLLGIGITYFVGVDFTAFKQAVDAVGGVNIDVPAGFTDNQYPAGECDLGNCRYETVHFNAGMQHMNGARALIYARSRHGNNGQGSDFARSRRQQQIIVALKAEIESIGGIGKLPDVINALGDNVLTNLTIGDAEFDLLAGSGGESGDDRARQHRRQQLPVQLRLSGALRRRLLLRGRSELQIHLPLRPGRVPHTGCTRRRREDRVRRRERKQRQRLGALGIPHEDARVRHLERRQGAETGRDSGDRQQRRQGHACRRLARRVLRRVRHDAAGRDPRDHADGDPHGERIIGGNHRRAGQCRGAGVPR